MAKYYTPTQLSENIKETPEGFLLCIGVPIARTGEMLYGEGETPLETDEEGQILIYRDADEVFNVDTIASFEGKAITIKHPEQFVSPQNWSYLAKGIIQNVRKAPQKDEDGEESLLADLLITDALAIQLIKNGLREVSCGYEAEYEQTGEGKGRQSNIIGNHLALVEQGRAGQSYAINDHKGKKTMKTLAENMKKFFGKAVDEAMAEKKDEEKKSKDAESEKKDEDKKEDKSMDKGAYDELVKMVKDLGEKIEGMGKPKDESSEKKEEEKSKDEDGEEEKKDSEDEDKEKKEEEKSKDEDGNKMEERLKALEAAVAKLLESKSGDEKESEDEEEKKEDPKKTGDSKTGLEKTKNAQAFDHVDNVAEPMTAEKMNEINAAHWARK